MCTCPYEATAGVLGVHAQTGHSRRLPEPYIVCLQTPEDCWIAYLQPYTIRAQRWSAKRTCSYEAKTDVLGRREKPGMQGCYHSSALTF